LRINSLELESELNLLNPQRVNLDLANQAEPTVKRYIEQRFRIATASHPKCRHHWVGMELERLDLWIYFELEPAGAETPEKAVLLDDLQIYNAVLMHRNPEQINLVNFTHGRTIRSSHHSNEAPKASPVRTAVDSSSAGNGVHQPVQILPGAR
ncbi:MAG: hypothetical protein KDA96_25595, partial [Planctomycetaceae bacterium]|nr:hypothetical protein [Planctomycetaceae bacterium]